jgi:hypothetical protein
MRHIDEAKMMHEGFPKKHNNEKMMLNNIKWDARDLQEDKR